MPWPFTRAYDIAKLDRDAAHICDDAERRFRREEIQALADALREHLEDAQRRIASPRMTTGNIIAELRSRHREARRRRQDRQLSEITLAIIRLRAEEQGATGAIERIDDFLARWPADGLGPAAGES